jgi:hypothetical protein
MLTCFNLGYSIVKLFYQTKNIFFLCALKLVTIIHLVKKNGILCETSRLKGEIISSCLFSMNHPKQLAHFASY